MVSLMIGLWLGSVALAVSPELHHWFHQDSGNVNHECLVTLVSKGHFLAGTASGVAAIVAAVFFGLFLLAVVWNLPVTDFRLSPSRAPPVVSLQS